MKIKALSPITINRIAAGEVVERPASAVKELVENSIDAGATQIDVVINNGGRNLISITDNGSGMSKEELDIAVQRHTTSKLDESDITDIQHFGFRGEALPSIASVSRMTLTSKQTGMEHAWSININGGEKVDLIPASMKEGTKIEVRDLFFATPARLKFLKSERVEVQHINDIVKKLAMAHPNIGFSLKSESKTSLNVTAQPDMLGARKTRLSNIMGKEFIDNSIEISTEREGIKLSGLVSLPTFNRGTSSEQYLFVNGRPVRDRLLLAVVKVAYQDFLAPNRHPVVVLFLDLPPREVDVNVHPAKAEVRFRDSGHIRSIIISSLKNALTNAGHRASTTVAQNAIESFIPRTAPSFSHTPSNSAPRLNDAQIEQLYSVSTQTSVLEKHEPVIKAPEPVEQIEELNYPLGAAKCQLHKTYVVSQTDDSIIIVDQHAAHERLLYEELKTKAKENSVKTQRVLIPEIVELDEKIVDKLMQKKDHLKTMGLVIEQNGHNAVRVTETPAIIGEADLKQLVKNIGDDLLEFGEDATLSELIEHIVGTFACHHSIRAGRIMNITEMNSLLRSMEKTPHSGQCNHGRPTYVELKLTDIEKLFGRS